MVGVGVAKKRTLRFEGATALRSRLVLSLLSGLPVRISGIRSDATHPGLCPAEISFIRLLDKLTAGSAIHINDSGTVLVFRPGHLAGPPKGVSTLVSHACHPSRALSYYARPLLQLAPFFKTPLRVLLRGATHAPTDICVDSLAAVTCPLLRRLSLGANLSPHVEVRKRSMGDDGEVLVSCGVLAGKLKPIDLIEGGVVKRIRGTAYAARTSPSALARMIDTVRGVLNRFTPDVYIHTDHSAKGTPGYALHLIAETTEGCLVSGSWATADAAMTPEVVAQTAVNILLEEVAGGGCVDSDHGHEALLFAALSDSEVSRVRLGRMSESCIHLLRDLRDFFGVVFKIRVEEGAPEYEDSEDEESESSEDEDATAEGDGGENAKQRKKKKAKGRGIVLSCVGIGQSNVARQRF